LRKVRSGKWQKYFVRFSTYFHAGDLGVINHFRKIASTCSKHKEEVSNLMKRSDGLGGKLFNFRRYAQES
jgi:hypothetical protein